MAHLFGVLCEYLGGGSSRDLRAAGSQIATPPPISLLARDPKQVSLLKANEGGLQI